VITNGMAMALLKFRVVEWIWVSMSSAQLLELYLMITKNLIMRQYNES